MENIRVKELRDVINITNKMTGDYKKDIEVMRGLKNEQTAK